MASSARVKAMSQSPGPAARAASPTRKNVASRWPPGPQDPPGLVEVHPGEWIRPGGGESYDYQDTVIARRPG